jgi:hypothetical protein
MTMSPGLSTRPMVALAARMGPKSGRLLRSIGVGTVTMNTVHAASSAGSAV